MRYFSFRWDLETQTRIFLYLNLKSHNVTESRLKILYTNTRLYTEGYTLVRGLYNEIEENIYNFFRFICFQVSKLVACQK